MNGATAPGLALDVLRRPAPVAGDLDLAQVRAAFDGLGTDPGSRLLVGRCLPTAAFSRRDLLLPGIERAQTAAASSGFAPAVRHVGGHLAAYDEGSLVMHLWSAHKEPARDLQLRFRTLSAALRDALHRLGVPDARVGAVPGEYCDGGWSVNAAGRAKLAGTGQRISRHGWMWSAVLTVTRPEAVRDVLTRTYRELALHLDPETVGSISDHVPGITPHEVAETVTAAVASVATQGAILRSV